MDAVPERHNGPQHFNTTGCVIKVTQDGGRGVYASRFIPRNTVIDISPVLIFSKDEYEQHGKYTVLHHYTFIWTDGRMALALGLGSLFNHSQSPSVSYTLDKELECIEYTTVRDINPEEEICIYHGHKPWFSSSESGIQNSADEQVNDGWGGLAVVGEDDTTSNEITNPYADGPQDEIIPEEELPFTRFKLPPEEEDAESIKTVQAWVVDVLDPRHITTLLKWLKQAGLDDPDLGHLKRIRKQGATTSLLLSTDSDAPQLPQDLNLPAPYQFPVPISSALTLPSLTLKSALWPTMYTPRRKDEPEPWTRGKLKWAWGSMKKTVDMALKAQLDDEELPIAALIPEQFNPITGTEHSQDSSTSFIASDTRRTASHPLRHASINAVRKLADSQAVKSQNSEISPSPSDNDQVAQNGSNYLLTDCTFFITHEPCIMCSMALLHSRVKEVIYLYPMSKTGGCGGCACLPTLKGVNHRFTILQWKLGGQFGVFSENKLIVDEEIDA